MTYLYRLDGKRPSSHVHKCVAAAVKRPSDVVNLGRPCSIVLSISAAILGRIHLPSGSDIT